MTSKSLLPVLAAAVTLVTAATGAQAAVVTDFITNGNFSATTLTQSSTFKDGSVTGWNSIVNPATGNYGYNLYYTSIAAAKSPGAVDAVFGFGNQALYATAQASTNGGAFVALDGDQGANGKLTQMINGLTVGKNYRLNFEWAAAQITTRTGATNERLDVIFGNQTFSTATVQNPSGGFQGWFNVSMNFTATSTSQLLSFMSVGGPTGLPPVALLDGVNLTAVPEPATWGMMLLGFGMVGAAARNRRRTVVVAA